MNLRLSGSNSAPPSCGRNSRSSSAPAISGQKKTTVDDVAAEEETSLLANVSPAQQRRDRQHQRFLADVARTGYRRAPRFLLRAWDRQRPCRNSEYAVRRSALAFRRWAAWCGVSLNQTAALLGLDRSTLLEWQSRRADQQDRLQPRPLGAPAYTCSESERQAMLEFLALHPGSNVLDLLCHFPHIPYREHHRFHTIYGVNLRDRRSLDHLPKLIWEKPGRVWAIDFTFPDQPIDGCFRGVLCVRDLASGCTLAADPVVTDDALAAIATLTILFRVHGTPLVIKMDNGPAFTSAAFQAFLELSQVTILYSPTYTPTFNGAVEAGNGVIKSHAEYLANLSGSPGLWSSNHVEGARLWANSHCPKNRTHSAEHDWDHRADIAAAERTAFANLLTAAMERRQREADLLAQRLAEKTAQASTPQGAEQTAERELASPPRPNTITPDAIRRHAIADALTYTGNLHIRSRRVSQRVPRAIGLRIA
jgi:transposase InsO family protein